MEPWISKGQYRINGISYYRLFASSKIAFIQKESVLKYIEELINPIDWIDPLLIRIYSTSICHYGIEYHWFSVSEECQIVQFDEEFNHSIWNLVILMK